MDGEDRLALLITLSELQGFVVLRSLAAIRPWTLQLPLETVFSSCSASAKARFLSAVFVLQINVTRVVSLRLGLQFLARRRVIFQGNVLLHFDTHTSTAYPRAGGRARLRLP